MLVMVGGGALAAPVSEVAKSAREAAREYGAAVRNCDMGWALDSMYPPLRRTYADQLSSRDPRMEAANARRIMGAQDEPQESEFHLSEIMDAAPLNEQLKYATVGDVDTILNHYIQSFGDGVFHDLPDLHEEVPDFGAFVQLHIF